MDQKAKKKTTRTKRTRKVSMTLFPAPILPALSVSPPVGTGTPESICIGVPFVPGIDSAIFSIY